MDVTVRHPLAQKYRESTRRTDGAAAAEAERTKRRRYPAVADMGLVAVRPFAIETHGRLSRLGAEALAILGDARQRVAERLGERCVARSGIVSRRFGLLQCQLLLAQHEASVAMLGASVAPLAVASLGFR